MRELSLDDALALSVLEIRTKHQVSVHQAARLQASAEVYHQIGSARDLMELKRATLALHEFLTGHTWSFGVQHP